MADTDEAEGNQNLEAPEDEIQDEALLHISKYCEARRALPWEQWTYKEKAMYFMDHIFIGILVIFILVMLGECSYKMWYVTNVKKIAVFVSDSVAFVSSWLFTQEGQEELLEL